jgi:hypothetical protein
VSVIHALSAEWEAKGCSSFDPTSSPTTMVTQKKKRVKIHLVQSLEFKKHCFDTDDKDAMYMENIPAKEGVLLEL